MPQATLFCLGEREREKETAAGDSVYSLDHLVRRRESEKITGEQQQQLWVFGKGGIGTQCHSKISRFSSFQCSCGESQRSDRRITSKN